MEKQTKSIWILEDDQGCQFVYEEILELRYKTRFFSEAAPFIAALREPSGNPPDLLIADIRLPDQNLLTVLSSDDGAALQEFPFIVVSSVDDMDALRLCYEKGASDYITKPFGKAELIVKVERLLSAPQDVPPGPDEVRINPTHLTISRGELTSVPLTSKEFQLLTLLQQAEEQKLSRETIKSQVWGGTLVSSKTLDVHIFNLRKKISELGLEIRFQNPDSFQLLRHRVDG